MALWFNYTGGMAERSRRNPVVPPDDIPTYSNVAFSGAWAGRSRAMWGCAAVGLVFGALIGLIAPFFPVPFVASMSWSAAAALVPTSAAIFSAVGMLTGFAVGAINGTAAGAAAGATKELERRLRDHEIELGIAPSREAAPPPTKPQEEKPFVLEEYFNLRIGAVFAALGAVGGLVLSWACNSGMADAALPAMKTLLGGAATNPTAVTSYITGLMTSFGALWCFNFQKIATFFQDISGRLMSGELLGTQWGPAKEKAPYIAVAQEIPAIAQGTPPPLALPSPSAEQGQATAAWIAAARSGRFQEMLAGRAVAAEEVRETFGR